MTPRFSGSAFAACGAWCVMVVLTLMPFGVGHAAALDVAQLMQGLAQARSGHAVFTEKKFIAMLDKPVESSGELFYRAPDRLEKRTLKPKPESMILDGDTIVIERGRQKHTLQLQDYPHPRHSGGGPQGTGTQLPVDSRGRCRAVDPAIAAGR
jgi:outer membrane lipoprotein-sorting protein